MSSQSPLKRKRSALDALRPSEGFLAASKSRSSLPDDLLQTEENDDPIDSSPSKKSGWRSLGRTSGGGSGPSGQSPSTTPTKSKKQGVIFVSSIDPRLRGRATPKRTKSGASSATPKSRSPTKANGRSPNKELEHSTPSKTRRRRNGTHVSDPEEDEDEEPQSPTKRKPGSNAASNLKRRASFATTEEVSEPDYTSQADADEEENGEEEDLDRASEDEEVSSDDDQPITSPSKSSPTKRSRKKPPDNLLHVPGFITQSSFDLYFQQMSISARTSSSTFSSLLPTLSFEEYVELLDGSASRTKHSEELERLRESHVALFPRFMMELQAGFNLLFYGFGSKREVLNQFAKDSCALKGDVIVLNAYRDGVTIKNLLNKLEGLSGDRVDTTPTSISALSALDVQARRIYQHYLAPTSRPVFIIIHNIDSAPLRNPKNKSILSLLASNPRIHLVGSVDHVNAPLIWTQSEASARGFPAGSQNESPKAGGSAQQPLDIPSEHGFSWLWHDLTTFEHYDVELRSQGRDLTSVAVAGSGKTKLPVFGNTSLGGPAAAAGPLTEVGAQQVLQSVTERSKKVFVILATKQLENIEAEVDDREGSNVTAPQMSRFATSYEMLFSTARESFIATSDQALRGLLQEFKDHGMVVLGAAATGGGEVIWIPLPRSTLQKLLDSCNEQ